MPYQGRLVEVSSFFRYEVDAGFPEQVVEDGLAGWAERLAELLEVVFASAEGIFSTA